MVIEPVLEKSKPIDGDQESSGASVRAAAMGVVDVVTAFQPIVSLDDEKVVGYEALSRWPSVMDASPEAVFAVAAVAGVVDTLDRRCIKAALAAAVTADLPHRGLLMINTEPGTTSVVSAHDSWTTDALDKYQVVFELTERDLGAHPGPLLTKVAALRAAGMRIAVDDVGSHPDVLAWLDVIDPDVVKLDLSLIQYPPAPEQARVLTAVYCHHERSGAVIVAEGIETETHLEQARAVGATLGQGYRFGAPAPGGRISPARRGIAPDLSTRIRPSRSDVDTPFDLVGHYDTGSRVAPEHLLAAFSRDIQTHAGHATDRPMVLAAVQHAEHVPASARARYQRLARSCSLVAVFGCDLPADVGAGVVGVGLDAEDPLCTEWTLVALGSHTAFALIARELAQPAIGDGERRFAFVMTTDRPLVASAAANLLSRIR